MGVRLRTVGWLSAVGLVGALGSCGGGAGSEGGGVNPKPVAAADGDYVVLAWNDLGMHCLNPTYDSAVILPPYNNVWAQVIRRAPVPELVTTGLTIHYRLVNNTSSAGKTDDLGGDFGQFWTNAEALFGVAGLATDTGLNLVDPALHNGLSGDLVVSGDHFEVDGIPVVPVDDDGVWSPYQLGELTVVDGTGATLATTRITVPTSDEIACDKCHAQGGPATVAIGGGTASVFDNVLALHDTRMGTTLAAQKPVLCASCHASPVLGQPDRLAGGQPYLSEAVHGFHADTGARCYDCHPGDRTRCSRSLAHRGADGEGNCTTCHGDLAEVGGSITSGARVPWVNEPKCATCHPGVAQVDTGDTLFRRAAGHGGVYCAACHGSPHAMVPSAQDSDNAPNIALQGAPKSLGSCGVCHANSHGEGAGDFGETHGGAGAQTSACNVCHTSISGGTASWPHQFQWKAR